MALDTRGFQVSTDFGRFPGLRTPVHLGCVCVTFEPQGDRPGMHTGPDGKHPEKGRLEGLALGSGGGWVGRGVGAVGRGEGGRVINTNGQTEPWRM